MYGMPSIYYENIEKHYGRKEAEKMARNYYWKKVYKKPRSYKRNYRRY